MSYENWICNQDLDELRVNFMDNLSKIDMKIADIINDAFEEFCLTTYNDEQIGNADLEYDRMKEDKALEGKDE